ncbi:FAD-dependent monooxygenase [Streptomyces sp. Marseille-Q5077]|uniref:FAD-dependent monooxygenase n=1 Tax=Streptomyces sp. Marseille-Q5077 TaxID=3418995 RepID=UPI003D059AD5
MTERQTRRATDVVVLGAGPAGLVLGNLLQDSGIDCVILERAERAHIQTRARAGFLAANTVRILERHGLAEGLHRHGQAHSTCEFRTVDGRFRLDYSGLGRGERHTVHPQQQLVTDLLTRFLAAGGRVDFTTEAVAVLDTDTDRPSVTVREADGRTGRWRARYVAGCDGRHGAAPIAAARPVRHHCDHGVTWLDCRSRRRPVWTPSGTRCTSEVSPGHARTSEITRYYVQCGARHPGRCLVRGPDLGRAGLRMWGRSTARCTAPRRAASRRRPGVRRARTLRHGSLFWSATPPASSALPRRRAPTSRSWRGRSRRALVDDLVHGDSGGARRLLRAVPGVHLACPGVLALDDPVHGPSGSDGPSLFHKSLRRSRIASLRTSRSHQDWFAEHYVGV